MYVLLLDVLFHGKKHQKQAPLLDLGGGTTYIASSLREWHV